MTFPLHFPCTTEALRNLSLSPGEILFALGANGVGKSSLMQVFAQHNRNCSRKISAHRQTWFASDSLDITAAGKLQIDQTIKNDDANLLGRHKDHYASQRASLTIYDLIEAENVWARSIAAEVVAGRMELAAQMARIEAPIKVINELLRISNIPIEIFIAANERVMAVKNGGAPYSAAELSDGERNALLIAGSVLTAPPDTLIIVDEPERHLHKSIISPLLTALFNSRSDCAFVVATHDHELPLANPSARTLLIRSCQFNGQTVQSWDADEVAIDGIDDSLRRDLLGARRRILFIEGTESSLDKPLYSLIFPDVSIIPKGSCRDVEISVQGIASGDALHWISAFGIVDRDGYDSDAVKIKAAQGVYALPYYSVEAIYFHPEIIRMIANAQASMIGCDAQSLMSSAVSAGIERVREHHLRLCENSVKKAVAKAINDQLPSSDQYLRDVNVQLKVDSAIMLADRQRILSAAIDANDWLAIIEFCPIKAFGIRDQIVKALKLQNVADYERAVINLLKKDATSLAFVRSLFLDLQKKLAA